MRRPPRWRARRAAVLHATIGERLPAVPPIPLVLTTPRPTWTPSPGTRAMLSAISALPRLAASIGMIAADPNAHIELLPGSPTTVMFIGGGRIRGLFILPIGEDEARALLRLPLTTARDAVTDRLFEDGRQIDFQDRLDLGLELEGADAC